MKLPTIGKSILLASVLGLTGCINDVFEDPSEAPAASQLIDFDIEFESKAGDTFADSPLYDYFIDGRSVILISQRGQNLSINFNDYLISSTDPSVMEKNENLYKYVYYTNPTADWDQGFNFQPYGNNALDWNLIQQGGEYNGGYALGALYYPIGYTVDNSVQTDQSVRDNLLRSNVLGAWHLTNSLQSRIRFRFFHLMSAMRVTLLIPDWDPADNSGFGEDAAKSAQFLKLKTDYSIEWPNNLTSEEPPTPLFTSDAEAHDIEMYLESVSNDVETINLKTLNPDYDDITENVRKATFIAIFPPQQPYMEGPAMRFTLNTMGGTERKYIWYVNDLVSSSSLNISRGTLTNLTLYIPRTENNAILIKSYIVPWTEAESEFTVIPDKN